MAVINFARREIITKIVYFGAAGAGTSSNLRTLYIDLPGEPQGGLLPFGPRHEDEQSLVCELIPEGFEVPGFTLKARLYSLPGGLEDRFHRDEILRDIDAVVFVADARAGRSEHNIDALLDLDRHLKELDQDLNAMPMVFQVNHTDHADSEPASEVVYDLNPYGHPVVAASARGGEGVRLTLEHCMEGITLRVRDNLAGRPTALQVHAIHRREATSVEQVIEAHERAITLARSEAATPRDSSSTPAPWSRSHYDILPTGLGVEVPYQPAELNGMRPVHILDTRIDRETVQVDIVMDDQEGGHPTRLRVILVPPGDPTTPTLGAGTVPAVPQREEITATLPDRIEIVAASPDVTPPLWYSVAGVGAGVVVGVLLGFLIWA